MTVKQYIQHNHWACLEWCYNEQLPIKISGVPSFILYFSSLGCAASLPCYPAALGECSFQNIHRVSSEMCRFTVCSPLRQGFVGPWQMESSWKHVLSSELSSHTVLEQCVKKTHLQSAFCSVTQSGGFLPLDLKNCTLLC